MLGNRNTNAQARFLVLDVEGTLMVSTQDPTGPAPCTSLWYALAQALGPDAVESYNDRLGRWKANGYPTYLHWSTEALEDLCRRSLNRPIFERVLSGFSFRPGTDDLFAFATEAGLVPVLVSGGFSELADIVIARYGVRHSHCSIRFVWDREDNIAGWAINPTDYKDKARQVQLLCETYNCALSDCAFVGDSSNDVPVASMVGFSVAIGDDPHLIRVCHYAAPDLEDAVSALRRWNAAARHKPDEPIPRNG
jgi:phosphoserine phosphatase